MDANGSAPTPAAAQTNQTTTQAADPNKQNGQANPQAGEAKAQADAVKEAAAEVRRKLKIDDQEIDEDEVIKTYKERKGHQQAANKSLQEGKIAKQKADALFQALKDEGMLFQALQELGHNPRTLAEKYLANQIEEEMMDPKDKELRDLRKERDAARAKEKQQKEAEEKKLHEEMKSRFSQKYKDEFIKVLGENKLPQNKHTVAKMAEYIKLGASSGIEISPKDAAMLVRDDIEAAHKAIYGDLQAEELMKLLGEEKMQQLRAFDISRLKDPSSGLKTPTEQRDVQPRSKATGERWTESEWRKYNRSR